METTPVGQQPTSLVNPAPLPQQKPNIQQPAGDTITSSQNTPSSCFAFFESIFNCIYNWLSYLFGCGPKKTELEQAQELYQTRLNSPSSKIYPKEMIDAFGGLDAFNQIPNLTLEPHHLVLRFEDLPHSIVTGISPIRDRYISRKSEKCESKYVSPGFVAIKVKSKSDQQERVFTFMQTNAYKWCVLGDFPEELGLHQSDTSFYVTPSMRAALWPPIIDAAEYPEIYSQIKAIVSGNHPHLELGEGNPQVASLLKMDLKDSKGDAIDPWNMIDTPEQQTPPFKEQVDQIFKSQEKNFTTLDLGNRVVGLDFPLKPEDFKGIAHGTDISGRSWYAFKCKNKKEEPVEISLFWQRFINNNVVWSVMDTGRPDRECHLDEENLEIAKQIITGTHPEIDLVL